MPSSSERHAAQLTRGTENDPEGLRRHPAEFGDPASADRLLDQLVSTLQGLEPYPERGNAPSELAALGIKAQRRVLFKPWPLINRIKGAALPQAREPHSVL